MTAQTAAVQPTKPSARAALDPGGYKAAMRRIAKLERKKKAADAAAKRQERFEKAAAKAEGIVSARRKSGPLCKCCKGKCVFEFSG